MSQKTKDVLIFQAEEGNIVGPNIKSELCGYSGKGYVTDFNNDGDFAEINFNVSEDGYYSIHIVYRTVNDLEFQKNLIMIDEYCYSDMVFRKTDNFIEVNACDTFIKRGKHSLKLVKSHGGIAVDCFKIYKLNSVTNYTPDFKLVNPDPSRECINLMAYFKAIYGKKIITGQHTSAAKGPELDYIKDITGKLPALRGFDFLSYSHAINTKEQSEHGRIEIENNRGSVEKAIEWYTKYNGIVTFCWHWYSPIPGKDKSFYTEFTDFNLLEALKEGTPENKALIRDLDLIAEELKKLREAKVPVLWRPLHESEGFWFWWSAYGIDAYKKLYYLMFDRYTNYHKLNNLIWVWNAAKPGMYVGNDYADISSIDLYVPAGNYGPLKWNFDYASYLADNKKPVTLAEDGPIPDPDKLMESEAGWLWYMPWYGDIAMDGILTTKEHLKKVYNHPYTVTLEDLPDLKNYTK